jgi:Tfp pilus assembly protein PilO
VTRNKLLIPVLLGAVAIAAFWFLVLAPKRDQIAKLDADIATQESAASQSEQLVVAYTKAKDNYRENYTMVARLGKAVPGDDDVRSLLVQIGDAAERSKVTFRALNVSGAGSTPAAGAATTPNGLAPAPGAVSIGSAGFSAMPFNFSFSGSFFRLSDFLQRLERFVTVENDQIDVTGRLLLLGSIAVTPEAGDLGRLQAQIGAATYLVPPTEGVPGAPTPAPVAGGTPGATEGGTVPPTTTTATIRGVR